jgi:hypothetical protein
MIRMGATVPNSEDAQDISEAVLRDGAGGSCIGEALVNGTNDLRLGSNLELGMRFSCCRIAKIRKCKVM